MSNYEMVVDEENHRVTTFMDLADATMWLESSLNQYDLDEWVIENASIVYMSNRWRAGYIMSRKQKEMFNG